MPFAYRAGAPRPRGTRTAKFVMDRFFALLIFILAFALGLSSLIGYFEKRVEKFAKSR